MPKIVDHAERRAEIADALWKVIRRDGFAAVSVRSVAAESGWSPGAIRHYFASQGELTAFATATLADRVTARVMASPARPDDTEGAVALLEEILPLDAPRRAEAEVWLALVSAARTEPVLRDLTAESHRALRKFVAAVLGAWAQAQEVELDVAAETDRLHALLDGLALHGTLHPRSVTGTRMRGALRAHLDDLARRR